MWLSLPKNVDLINFGFWKVKSKCLGWGLQRRKKNIICFTHNYSWQTARYTVLCVCKNSRAAEADGLEMAVIRIGSSERPGEGNNGAFRKHMFLELPEKDRDKIFCQDMLTELCSNYRGPSRPAISPQVPPGICEGPQEFLVLTGPCFCWEVWVPSAESLSLRPPQWYGIL